VLEAGMLCAGIYYRGEPYLLDAGKTLQDDEKTLNDKQIDAVMKKIITNLQKQLGAQLR
jgi:mRNA degradation ribonuclease J1/J2